MSAPKYAEPAPGLRVGPVLAALMLALIPVQLDALVTATALPSIAGSLGGFDQIAWIATAYLLTMAIGTALAGRIGDLFGRRRVLVSALLVFLAGSVWVALSGTMTWLILGRAVQGLGAGMTFTTLLATVADIAPPAKRARYQGVVGAVAPFSMIVGPWVGGLVTDHLGWRWIFWLNAPLIGIALLGVLVLLRLPRGHTGGQVDVPGLVALAVAASGLTLAASWGGQYGWASAQVLVSAAVGLVGALGVWYAERRAQHPFLPLDLFTNRTTLMCFAIMALGTGAVMMSAMNYLPLFLQVVQGRSASSSGLLLLPMLLPAILVALAIGGWTSRSQRFRIALLAGTGLLVAGCALLAGMGAGTPGWQTAAWMVLTGAGIGMLFQTPLVVVQNSVPGGEVGAATGAASALRTIGGALGVGALGSVFVNRFAAVLGDSGVAGTAGLDPSRLDPATLDAMPSGVHAAVLDAAASANATLFWIAAGLAALALVAAALVPRRVAGAPGAGEGSADDGADEGADEQAGGSAAPAAEPVSA